VAALRWFESGATGAGPSMEFAFGLIASAGSLSIPIDINYYSEQFIEMNC
jgi:hypothetical protein